MNNKFSLYPDDRSNQFGNPNDLDTNGGVFDYNYDAPEDSTAAPTQNDASQSSPEYDRSDAETVSEAADLILSQSVSEPVKTAPQEKPKLRKKGSGAKNRRQSFGRVCAIGNRDCGAYPCGVAFCGKRFWIRACARD